MKVSVEYQLDKEKVKPEKASSFFSNELSFHKILSQWIRLKLFGVLVIIYYVLSLLLIIQEEIQ